MAKYTLQSKQIRRDGDVSTIKRIYKLLDNNKCWDDFAEKINIELALAKEVLEKTENFFMNLIKVGSNADES